MMLLMLLLLLLLMMIMMIMQPSVNTQSQSSLCMTHLIMRAKCDIGTSANVRNFIYNIYNRIKFNQTSNQKQN